MPPLRADGDLDSGQGSWERRGTTSGGPAAGARRATRGCSAASLRGPAPAGGCGLGGLSPTRPAGRERARAAPAREGGPRAVRAGAPDLTPAGRGRRSAAPDPPPPRPPSGTELVTTAVRATGELAQIGVTTGTRVARHVAGRLLGR